MSSATTSAKTTFAAVLALGFTAVLALFLASLGDDDDRPTVEASDVSWLYSQTADSAELDDLGDGNYRLILRDIDAHTIQFSDRPDRLVEIIDTARLVHHWESLFATSAPNAVLIEHEPSGETDSLVVVLENPDYDLAARTLTYDVRLLAEEKHPERLVALVDHHVRPPVAMRAVSLFIDSVQDASGGTGIDPATIAGPAAQMLLDQLAGSDLGGGVHLESANVDYSPADGTITGNAIITFDTAGFRLDVDIELTDADNWSLTTSVVNAATWTPANLPSLTIDPSTLSGTISMTDGTVSYDIVGTTHTWNLGSGVTYLSTPELAADCPLEESQCPIGVDGPYMAMNGTLSMVGVPNELTMTGAITTDGEWARLDGTAGDVTFDGYGITDTELTIWHGQRSDSYDPEMSLPSLASLNNGVDIEFCGGFSLPIPGHANKATDGCVRWSEAGVILGQIGVGIDVSGSLPATGTAADASAAVAGAVWSNIADATLAALPSGDAIMSGVHDAIESQTISLAGTATLPGVVADALNVDLGAADSFTFDVTGSISVNAFSLSAQVPANISIGSDPFKTNVRSVTATIEAKKGSGASFSLGTQGVATIGYQPKTRQVATSVELTAATPPAVGMSLSVTATGTPSNSDTGGNGLTSAQRLSDPKYAQYVWPDQFGIGGMNLWSLTAQIAYEDGSPSIGYTSTTYLDPNGSDTGSVIVCDGNCDAGDWLVGNLALNLSYTDPCFAYSFTSGSGTSGLGIDGGTLVVDTFQVGVAPSGCSIRTGSTTQSLPAGFAGFQFKAAFGSATLDVATQLSVDGFIFEAELDDLTLAGVTYEEVDLSITINDRGSDLVFTSVLDSGMGNMSITSEFETDDESTTQRIDASLTDWSWSAGGVDIESLTFTESATIPLTAEGCASFEAGIDGSITVAGNSLTFSAPTGESGSDGSTLTITCDGVQNLSLDVEYAHVGKAGTVTEQLVLEYPNADGNFYGETEFSYKNHFSKKYSGRTFSKDVTISIGMAITIDPSGDAGDDVFEFWGGFDADRVSGDLDCVVSTSDFTCSGKLRLNPSWAGVYHHTWDNL